VMELLGRRSWWLPTWLDAVLPHLNVEGTGVFDDGHEAAAPATAQPEPEPVELGHARPDQGDGDHEQERPGHAEQRVVLEADPPLDTPEPEEEPG
jgi:hypothetical protein